MLHIDVVDHSQQEELTTRSVHLYMRGRVCPAAEVLRQHEAHSERDNMQCLAHMMLPVDIHHLATRNILVTLRVGQMSLMRRTNSLAIHVTAEALLPIILDCLDGLHVQLACKLQPATCGFKLETPTGLPVS